MSDVSETAERSPETFGAPPARNGGPSVLSRVTTMFLKQREASVLAIAVVLFIYFAVTTPAFVSHGSFVNIAQYMAPYVIIGIGLVLLMVCGEIDLSVGFTWMLAPYVMHFFIDSGIPTWHNDLTSRTPPSRRRTVSSARSVCRPMSGVSGVGTALEAGAGAGPGGTLAGRAAASSAARSSSASPKLSASRRTVSRRGT